MGGERKKNGEREGDVEGLVSTLMQRFKITSASGMKHWPENFSTFLQLNEIGSAYMYCNLISSQYHLHPLLYIYIMLLYMYLAQGQQ